MKSKPYDRIGGSYTATRRPDPRIAKAIKAALGDARSVVNIGAGTGSYEPTDLDVIAVEPSPTMLAQRPPGAARAVQGAAERLPLPGKSVDAALAVLTVHHWPDRARAWAEIRRVVRSRAVFLTHDPWAPPFWLVRDYFPPILEIDRGRFPPFDAYRELGETTVEPIPIPHDCTDGFLAAYWRRPHAYLDPTVRANISSFATLPDDIEARGIAALEHDLATGAWQQTNTELLTLDEIDAGYRLVTCTLT